MAGTRATCNLADFRAQALARVNSYRAAGASCGAQGSFPAVPALAWNDALTQASLVHSEDMVALNFFSHTGSNGSSAGQRATAAGYVWSTWGENIAAGHTLPRHRTGLRQRHGQQQLPHLLDDDAGRRSIRPHPQPAAQMRTLPSTL